MQHGASQGQPLFPADGQVAGGRSARGLRAPPSGAPTPYVPEVSFGGHAVQAGKEAQVFDDLQIVVEGKLLRHVADLLAHRFGFRPTSIPATGRSRKWAAAGRREFGWSWICRRRSGRGSRRSRRGWASKLMLFTATKCAKALGEIFDNHGWLFRIHEGLFPGISSPTLFRPPTRKGLRWSPRPAGWSHKRSRRIQTRAQIRKAPSGIVHKEVDAIAYEQGLRTPRAPASAARTRSRMRRMDHDDSPGNFFFSSSGRSQKSIRP